MRALILLLLLLVATSAAWSQESIVMTGRLVDLDHAPVVGATIEADQANNPAISDREGCFELRVVTRTPFLFEVKTATGRTRTFDAYPRRGADLGDLLICPGGSVVGRLIDGKGDQVVAGFAVRLASSTTDDENDEFTHPTHVVESAIDPATGEFRFLDVPPGLYTLTATEEGDPFPFHGKDLLVEPGRELYLEYPVTPPSVLEVSLVCADPNLLVLGLPSLVAVVEGGGGVHALPNLGVYRFENLPPGTVRFFLPGAELENPDRRHASDAGRVLVRWRPAKVLEFTALTPGGDPLPALVRMHDPRSGFQPSAVHGGIQGEWDPRAGPLRVTSFLERSGADLFLTPDGYLTHHEFLGVLEEGVQRREVVFHKPERREVTFQSGAGGLPLAGAVVRIQSRSMSARWDQRVKQLSGDGRLLIDVAPNTKTDLQVDWGHGIVENYACHHDGRSDESLRAPDVGWLRGAVQLPAGLDPTQYEVRTDAATFGTLAADGSFAAGPLRVGKTELFLWRAGKYVSFLRSEVSAGENEPHTIDFADSFPAFIDVALRVPGGLRQASLKIPELQRLEGRTPLVAGRGRLEVPAGTYTFEVWEIRRRWVYTDPVPLTVRAGEQTTREISFNLHRRRLRVLDAQGEPCAGRFYLRHGDAARWSLRTEDEALELELPPGNIRIWPRGAEEEDATQVWWGPGSGTLRVRLPE